MRRPVDFGAPDHGILCPVRHFILLFVAALAAYGLWQLSGRHHLNRWARHGVRLAAIAAVLLAALVVAYHSNALKVL